MVNPEAGAYLTTANGLSNVKASGEELYRTAFPSAFCIQYSTWPNNYYIFSLVLLLLLN